ncbi:MAG: polyprenyl diphosphate synthase [Patescibacteria group bacterium]|nr:polyprenyl diphosphate synthase [Patescibacteria group bacterium]
MEQKIPQCIGIIMDGNRRWAKEKGLPTFAGHKAGYDKLKETVRWAKGVGIKHIIAYAFSTENWKRPKEEVGYLMDLLRFFVKNEIEELKKENVHVRFIGELERLPEDIRKGIIEIEEKTKNGTLTLAVAVSYGARNEIVNALKRIVRENKVDEITEENFDDFLWTSSIPNPDLVIRTSGEQRLSNFLLWQVAYSELFFTKTYWPNFSQEEFLKIIEQFSNRERRNGK